MTFTAEGTRFGPIVRAYIVCVKTGPELMLVPDISRNADSRSDGASKFLMAPWPGIRRTTFAKVTAPADTCPGRVFVLPVKGPQEKHNP